MKSIRFCKQKGIGLLELMLSLAIIAILLIMATRYYQSASNSQAISSAIDMVNAVKSGVKNYMTSNTNSATYPDIKTLVTDGYLPQSYNNPSSANPWSGEICIDSGKATGCSGTAPSAGPLYSVFLDGVPSSICTELQNRLKGTINSAANEGVVDCATGTNGDKVGVVYAL